jgi:hypothetical protein
MICDAIVGLLESADKPANATTAALYRMRRNARDRA